MPKDLKSFLSLVFDEGEETCFSIDTYGTAVFSAGQIYYSGAGPWRFFSINPLNYYRLDRNVTAYRTFLLEFDSGTEQEQLELIEKIHLPYSSITSSGGKSIHVLIVLDKPLSSEAEYREMARHLHAAIPEADPSTINPSRLSRLPTGMRDGVEQRLIHVGGRVSLANLKDWLLQYPVEAKKLWGIEELQRTDKALSNDTVRFIFEGAPKGSRNSSLYRASCDMARAGYSIEEATRFLEPFLERTADFTTQEFTRTIQSAYDRVVSESRRGAQND